MIFGLDGVELGLIICFVCLFSGIMSGYPVAFAIGGSAIISFAILAVLSDSGILIKQVIDTSSDGYAALISQGVHRNAITVFRYPDLPRIGVELFDRGWMDGGVNRTLTFIVNRMNERVLAGPSIETLLAVAMFVMMGITLERSRIAEDLLTTMARVFGPLPGGLAVSVVVVGAFLAASTGIVGATVVTMGLLSLPTMLRNGYSPELSTGVIAASGTLGQIIPPSIVIVLLGSLAGDLFAGAQETRAQLAGCADALTYLGQAAVLSVGTLFKAAILPGVLLAVLYGVYAFLFAMWKPHLAPPVEFEETSGPGIMRHRKAIWFAVVPIVVVATLSGLIAGGFASSQNIPPLESLEQTRVPELRTNVSEQCKASMIALHGQEKWDQAVQTAKEIAAEQAATGGAVDVAEMTPEQRAARLAQAIADIPALSAPLLVLLTMLGLVMTTAYAIDDIDGRRPLLTGLAGVALSILVDAFLVSPTTIPGVVFLLQAIPFALIFAGLRGAVPILGRVDILRVVFPPLVLIVAVLGSILGGITNPTPAASLGAAGALMLAAYRRLSERPGKTKGGPVLWSAFAIVILLLVGVNFDLRANVEQVGFQNWVAIVVALAAYHVAIGGFLYACWVLFVDDVLTPVVRETAKVTSMVFTILIGSQMLNLVLISFGGEEYIQEFLRAMENEVVVFLVVMVVLFILGFVLDFLEIIYIVIPIVGPIIYGGTLDPKWVTIMIAVNLQTSFLTPPFGFALFYLRGVAPPSVTTGDIYRGAAPFVIIQVVGLLILWLFPGITTIVPDLLPGG